MEEEVVEPGCVGGAGGLGARKGQLRGTRTGQVTQVLGLLCRPRWGRVELLWWVRGTLTVTTN